MQAYRFRLLFADQDDFLRDIEIKPGQTFRDFHDIIVQSTGLDGNELASFFVCDSKWLKIKEITLIDMLEEDKPLEPERDENPEEPMPIQVMDKVKIRDVIEDPHQRLLYEYDFLNTKVFFIELTRIIDADQGKEYPRCVKKEGTLTLKAVPNYQSFLDEPDEDAMLKEVDDMIGTGNLEEEIDENFTTEPEW